MKILTLDIGGANIKSLFYQDGVVESKLDYFPIWKRKDELLHFLSRFEREVSVYAVTTTAELSDVFTSKRNGAQFIVDVCSNAFKDPYFLTTGKTLSTKNEIHDSITLAATNWLASTYYLEKYFGRGILVDVGSTTTDIIPFFDGSAQYKSDFERLKSHQLVYTGFLRTPINTIVSETPVNGQIIPLASEFFAITADVYNILWGIDYTCETPDGKGKSKKESSARLARLLCADLKEVEGDIEDFCNHIHSIQIGKISEAIEKVSIESGMNKIYVAGVGNKLGVEAANSLKLEVIDLENEIKDAWNLPCMGLVEMVKDKVKEQC